MNKIGSFLDSECERMQRVLKALEGRPAPLVEGRLEISCSRSRANYYWVRYDKASQKWTRKYIPPAETAFVRRLAEKQYLKNLNRIVPRRLKRLEALKKDLEMDEVECCFTQLSPARKELVQPIEPTRKMRQEAWVNEPNSIQKFAPRALVIETARGERVRSKSEKIIADGLHRHHIPYKYERPLFLDEETIYYPDFTMYDVDHDVEVYWEHFGLMDDPDYCKKTIAKIEKYEMNGVRLGERLVVTFESSNYSLNYRYVEFVIEAHLRDCVFVEE
ncbi:MAG: hypothetical protein PUJ57_06320 [Peptoniphilaceae bacterium]|nr:hypothetical protein [Peptoniphilaceae bacterium]MDY6085697.1 hypothetical protein [Peptoniphilaceae bacterium]